MRATRMAVAGCAAAALAVGVSACGDSGGGGSAKIEGKKLTIYSSLPQQGASAGQTEAMENGMRLALESVGGKVGDYSITYKPLDDSLASSGQADEGEGLQNARTAAGDKTTIGYLGEYNSGISKVVIPVLNKAGIAQISPANTYVGLTTDEPGSEQNEPEKYYPTGKRTYARVVPKDTIQGAALAKAAKDEGCKSVRIWNSKTTYSAGLSRNVEQSAKAIDLKVEGNDGIDPEAPNYESLAAKIKADCFIWTGEIEFNGTQVLKDAASAGDDIKLFAGDGNCLNASADPEKGIPPAIAPRFKCTIATLDPAKFGPEGKQFFEDYSKKYNEDTPDPYAIYGYESMALLLDAIKRASESGGDLTRQKVVDALFETKNRESVLGTYSIDENGDTSLTDYGLRRIEGKELVFDRVIKGQAAG